VGLVLDSSPYLVSLTKGFQFLPSAESPSLAATPLTPSIVDCGRSSSVETPLLGAAFGRLGAAAFAAGSTAAAAMAVDTPRRVEALRHDAAAASPGTSVISPTQFVLGRSTPYFVPSGERQRRPPIDQNATPEHPPTHDVRSLFLSP